MPRARGRRTRTRSYKGELAPAYMTCLHLTARVSCCTSWRGLCQFAPQDPKRKFRRKKLEAEANAGTATGGGQRRGSLGGVYAAVRQSPSRPVDRMATARYDREWASRRVAGDVTGFGEVLPWAGGQAPHPSLPGRDLRRRPDRSTTPTSGGSRSPRKAGRARTSRSTICSPRTTRPTTWPMSRSRTSCATTTGEPVDQPEVAELFGALRRPGPLRGRQPAALRLPRA